MKLYIIFLFNVLSINLIYSQKKNNELKYINFIETNKIEFEKYNKKVFKNNFNKIIFKYNDNSKIYDTGFENKSTKTIFFSYNEKTSLCFIEQIGYEFNKFYIKDSLNNQIFEIWSNPIFNKNESKFICFKLYGYENEPCGFQIFSYKKYGYNRIEKIYELDQKFWQPKEAIWINENEIILKIFPFKINYNKVKKFYYLKIKICQ